MIFVACQWMWDHLNKFEQVGFASVVRRLPDELNLPGYGGLLLVTVLGFGIGEWLWWSKLRPSLKRTFFPNCDEPSGREKEPQHLLEVLDLLVSPNFRAFCVFAALALWPHAAFANHGYYLAGFFLVLVEIGIRSWQCGVDAARKRGSDISENVIDNIGYGVLSGCGLSMVALLVMHNVAPVFDIHSNPALIFFFCVAFLGGYVGYRKSHPGLNTKCGKVSVLKETAHFFDGAAKAGRAGFNIVESIVAIVWGAGCLLAAIAFMADGSHRGGLGSSDPGLGIAAFVIALLVGGIPLFHGLRLLTKTLGGEAPLENSGVHGRMRIAAAGELRAAGLLGHAGNVSAVYLGNLIETPLEHARLTRDAVTYGGGVHLLTVGPPGSGKGAGLIMPNLSRLERSILVIDPKGEAAAITARKRAQMGEVVMLNPFQIFGTTHRHLRSRGFNPLINFPDERTSRFNIEATKLAQAIVTIESKQEPFFEQAAQNLLAAYIMTEVVESRAIDAVPSLGRVRAKLCEPPRRHVEDMTRIGISAIINKVGDLAGDGEHKTLQSVMMTLRTQTAFLDDEELVADLSTPASFDFKDMRREIMTVYVVVPPTDTKRNAKWLRLVILSALRAFVDTGPMGDLGPVLFLLDEFANLGRLEDIEDAMATTRGYGVQLWPIVQNLSQLKHDYGDRWESIVSAAEIKTVFRCQDNFTAEYFSKMAGNRTAFAEGQNSGEGPGGERSGRSLSQVGGRLFRPEDLGRLGDGQMLCFAKQQYPFMTHAPLYVNTPYREGLDPNPYFRRRSA
jgi:type IV secretion system protein VirD4